MPLWECRGCKGVRFRYVDLTQGPPCLPISHPLKLPIPTIKKGESKKGEPTQNGTTTENEKNTTENEKNTTENEKKENVPLTMDDLGLDNYFPEPKNILKEEKEDETEEYLRRNYTLAENISSKPVTKEQKSNAQKLPEKAEKGRQTLSQEVQRDTQALPEETQRNAQTAPGEAQGDSQALPGGAQRDAQALPGEAQGDSQALPREAQRDAQALSGEAQRNAQVVPEGSQEPAQAIPVGAQKKTYQRPQHRNIRRSRFKTQSSNKRLLHKEDQPAEVLERGPRRDSTKQRPTGQAGDTAGKRTPLLTDKTLLHEESPLPGSLDEATIRRYEIEEMWYRVQVDRFMPQPVRPLAPRGRWHTQLKIRHFIQKVLNPIDTLRANIYKKEAYGPARVAVVWGGGKVSNWGCGCPVLPCICHVHSVKPHKKIPKGSRHPKGGSSRLMERLAMRVRIEERLHDKLGDLPPPALERPGEPLLCLGLERCAARRLLVKQLITAAERTRRQAAERYPCDPKCTARCRISYEYTVDMLRQQAQRDVLSEQRLLAPPGAPSPYGKLSLTPSLERRSSALPAPRKRFKPRTSHTPTHKGTIVSV